MPGKPERKLERVSGKVVSQLVREGSAGEHTAVVLEAAGERLILQRRGGNPFDDAETRGLAGRRVTVSGYRVGKVFRYVSAEVVEDDD